MLKGYKTYILTGVAAISVIAQYLVGDLGLTEAINALLATGIVAALRDAISGVSKSPSQ
jgi:hypothetical protein